VKGRRTGRRPGGGAVIKDGDAPHPEAKAAGIGDADTAGFDPGRIGGPTGRSRFVCRGYGPRWEAGAGPPRKEGGADVASVAVIRPEGLGLRSGRVFQGRP
jgi:hypothetical protein